MHCRAFSLRVDSFTQRGRGMTLWPRRHLTLYRGDCLHVMQTIPNASIDLILCDLPYGTIAKSTSASKEAIARDTVLDFKSMWSQYWRILKPDGIIVLCSMQPFT